MVSGLVAYDKGAQKARQKRRAQAPTSPRRAAIMRRKSAQLSARQRTANTRRTQGNARERTHVLERGRNTLCGGNYLAERNTRDSVSSAPALLCAFYKKIMRDLGGQRIDFCGHRAYNSIMAKGKKINKW